MMDVVDNAYWIDNCARWGSQKDEMTAWLDDPTLFWLHPEGPLSDLTVDEWKAEHSPPRTAIVICGKGALATLGHSAVDYWVPYYGDVRR